MAETIFSQAINDALREEMRRNPDILILGEDVGMAGGVRGVTKGLWQEFGDERVKDTPISEATIVGVGVGCAITGLRPVVEIMYSDFLGIAMDEVMNKMAKWRYMHGSVLSVPMVLRTSCGGGFGGAAEHSQSLEALFMHIPGLQVVYPSTPYDAKGLLKTILRDNNPSLFFEHRLLYRTKGEVPAEEFTIPLGKADVKRAGSDLTLVAVGLQVLNALSAAEKLQKVGIRVRIDHHPSLKPFDRDLLYNMASKVSCIVTLENHCVSGGLYSLVAEALVARGIGVPVGAIGTDPDDYIHTGHVNDLLYRYKMTSDDVVEKALETLRIRTGS